MLRTNYFLPGPEAVRVVQARPDAGPADAAAAAAVRDLRALAAGRGRAPARRVGRARRPALVGPARGLPHRDPRPDEGADGQERADRAGRREGRVRGQAPPATRSSSATRRSSAGCWTSPTRSPAARSCRRAHVVRHDGDDPYLVVAADKGTATFSRHRQRGRASSTASGSATRSRPAARSATTTRRWGSPRARAWVSVQRHFRELGVDVQAEDFTVAGVGDMSGDVFGNGMLLSRAHPARRGVRPPPRVPRPGSRTRRPRAPSAGGCSSCRARRGTTTTRALISEGGGVFPRTAKSIELSPQVREALDVDAERLTPSELIQAILRAPVDLLWNGGIGTYVKASHETHADVGDKANDAVRVNGRDLRARVVGEGGNLGFTQRGRVEYALDGRARQHRRDRQRRRRQLLRPRGQHQGPARLGRRRRRHDRQAAQRAAGGDDRRGRRARAARQLHADAGAVAGARAGAGDARRARPVHARARVGRAARPRARGAARRRDGRRAPDRRARASRSPSWR